MMAISALFCGSLGGACGACFMSRQTLDYGNGVGWVGGVSITPDHGQAVDRSAYEGKGDEGGDHGMDRRIVVPAGSLAMGGRPSLARASL